MFGVWVKIRDGNKPAYEIFKRHYSFTKYKRADNARMVGPGERMVLVTPNYDALFVWRKFIDKSGQTGVNCAVFRNEGKRLSSELILAAEQLAWERWPGERLYTFVNPRRIRSSNPGYCFLMAGWRRCGMTKKRKLLILEKVANG